MKEEQQYTTLQFPSKDELLITADVYEIPNPKGFILLCHRSHCNRAEYREIAPKLNDLGFSCMAIDQRSGMNVFGEINETSSLAKAKKLPTGFLDAQQDIEAAIDFWYQNNNNTPISLLGSSYAAALALRIAIHTDKVRTVIAFSPGEYLKNVTLARELQLLQKPIFITSARKEIETINELIWCIDPKYITHFKPKVEGVHGAKSLWPSVQGSETYWVPLKKFLHQNI